MTTKMVFLREMCTANTPNRLNDVWLNPARVSSVRFFRPQITELHAGNEVFYFNLTVGELIAKLESK